MENFEKEPNLEMENPLYNLLSSSELVEAQSFLKENETPLWEHWHQFITHYLRRGKSGETVRNVSDVLKFVIRRLRIVSIEKCNDPNFLREALFEAKDERNWSYVTFNSYLKGLNTYFLWLANRKYVEVNQIMMVEKCAEEQNEQYVFSHSQVKEIVYQVHNRRQSKLERFRNVFFIDLVRFMGGRPCELLSLEIRNIRPFQGTYQMFFKGAKQKGKVRYYRFPSFVRDSYEAYMNYRSELRNDETKVFISSSKRTGWTAKGMRGLMKRLGQELGFRVTAYAFRRYVATTLYKQGVSLQDIQQFLGHSRIITTMKYVERCCALTDSCSNKMAEIFDENRGL